MFCDSDNSSEPPESDRPGGAEIRRFGGRENPVYFLIESVSQSGHFGPPEGRGHGGVFRGVRDGTSAGPPGETSKTINDTIQEHSFITSLFCLVVFGSLSFGSSS